MHNKDQASNPLRSQALKGVKWSAINTWYGQATALIVLVIMARLLEPEDFGLFAIGQVIVMLLGAIADQGLSSALIQRKEIKPQHVYSVFWVALSLSVLLAVALIASRDVLASIFNNPALADILPALALIQILRTSASVAIALLIRALDFRRNAIVIICAATSGGIMAVLLGMKGFGVWSLVGQHLTASFVTLTLAWLLAHWHPRALFSFHHLREIWHFGAWIMVGNIIIQLNQRLDALLIGAFLGSHSVGLYSVGKRVIQMGDQTLSAAIGQVAVPSFAKIQDDDARIKIAYLNAVQSLATITFPMFALVALFAEEVTMIFLGLKWIEGAPVLAFLAIAATIGSLSRMDGAVLLAKGRAGLRLTIPASKAIGAIFAFLLGYTYGIVAVAAAMATMSVILGPLFVSLVKSVLPISHGEYYRCMLPMLVSTISACASAWGIDYLLNTRIPDWAMLAVAMPLALAVYWQVLMKTAPEVTKRLLGYARETLK